MADETVDVVLVYPQLLGLYGDRGNALALKHRAAVRDIGVRIIEVQPGEDVPSVADIYLLGGGEDGSMLAAADLLKGDRGLVSALRRGAACLAVCAGLQLLAREFAGPDGAIRPGLGVLDVRCRRLTGQRAVGEVVAEPLRLVDEPLSGYENHQGDALLGPAASALGLVRHGVGNGHDRLEGAVQGAVVATYLHGPVLVRNPSLADHLLAAAVGAPLRAWSDPSVDRLRRERLHAAEGLLSRLTRPRP
jgi:lipid II isoglutaminyl synthase (glutamine-hydrolysing)